MKERVKLIILDEKPYVVSGDEIKLGDEVIITVNGQYPSKVSCENQPVLDLIKNNQAQLITESADVIRLMNWETKNKKTEIQVELFPHADTLIVMEMLCRVVLWVQCIIAILKIKKRYKLEEKSISTV